MSATVFLAVSGHHHNQHNPSKKMTSRIDLEKWRAISASLRRMIAWLSDLR